MKSVMLAVFVMLATVATPATLATLATGAPPARAQTQTVTGRVVADDTGDPVVNARVSVTPPSTSASVVVTNDVGRFSLLAPSGRFTVAASKTGYSRREVAPAPGATVEVRLQRAVVISGRVINEFGEPAIEHLVLAEISPASAGNRSIANTFTDDRGEYRLGGLAAGTFSVSVFAIGSSRPVFGRSRVPERIYYPGTTAPADAQALRLQPGEDRIGIDFVVPAPEPPFASIIAERQQQAGAAALHRPDGTGVIRGRVSTADGRALPHAEVTLTAKNDVLQSRAMVADADGAFEFRELAPDTFQVSASKVGYSAVAPTDLAAGNAAPVSDRTLELAAGQTSEPVDLSLVRWGTLAGVVVDELGDPVQGASVEVLQTKYEAGRRRLVHAGGMAKLTDDRGRYRLLDVPPGAYVVSASVGGVMSAELPGYARSFFPGTPNPGAALFVTIGRSQDVVGVDLSLAHANTSRVAGKILNAAGEPTTGGSLSLVPSQRSASVIGAPIGGRVNDDGTFEFPNVVEGQYVIQVYRGVQNRSTEGEFGALPVSVSGSDVTGLILQASSGSAIRGRFVFDTFDRRKPPPTASAVELSPTPVDFDAAPPRTATADIHADWTFEMAGINGPRRLQLTRLPPEWSVKEIRARGVDVTDRPLPFGRREQSLSDVEVVLTDRVTELVGTVRDDQSRGVAGSAVILFSTFRDRWYPASRFLRRTVTAQDGTFSATGLPFGSYYAAVVAKPPTEGEDAWQEPAFLESLVPRASTVTLAEGQRQSVNLRR